MIHAVQNLNLATVETGKTRAPEKTSEDFLQMLDSSDSSFGDGVVAGPSGMDPAAVSGQVSWQQLQQDLFGGGEAAEWAYFGQPAQADGPDNVMAYSGLPSTGPAFAGTEADPGQQQVTFLENQTLNEFNNIAGTNYSGAPIPNLPSAQAQQTYNETLAANLFRNGETAPASAFYGGVAPSTSGTYTVVGGGDPATAKYFGADGQPISTV